MFGNRKDARRRRNSNRPRVHDDPVIRAIEESLAKRAGSGQKADSVSSEQDDVPFTVVAESVEDPADDVAPEETNLADDVAGGAQQVTAPAAPNETGGASGGPQGHGGAGGASSNDGEGLHPDSINAKIRKVMDSLQGLEHLSELVSLRYNPFLEMDENDVFDGKRLKPDALVQEFFRPNGNQNNAPQEAVASEPSPPPFMEVARLPKKDSRLATEEIDEEIDLTDLPISEIHSAVGRPLLPPEPEPEPEPEPPAGPGAAKPSGHGAPLSDRDRARRTLLVLSWFRQLQMHGPPSCLYLFIDHCHRMEWIDESCYKWLIALAQGVAEHDPELTFSDLELSTIELTEVHEANLLFLDDLFSDRLRFGERGYLSMQIGDYFEGT